MTTPIKLLKYQRKDLPKKISDFGLASLILGIILVIASFVIEPQHSLFNCLMMFALIINIGSGCLFFIALEYVTNTVWSVPIRRVIEMLSSIIMFSILLALPVIFNLAKVFEWANPEIIKDDKIIMAKSSYLNLPFFTTRTFIFYGVLVLFYKLLTNNSNKQDEAKEETLSKKNNKLSAIFIPIFALITTFTAFDWLMSLEPQWYSSIFGVYFFAGTVVSSLAVITIFSVLLNENDFFNFKLAKDHYYNLGALMFAFIVFWAYIAFCQFLLIWYGNLPEETSWYLNRWQGNWKLISLGIILIHFAIPFFALLTRAAKMNPKNLIAVSVLILFSQLYDLYWMVMPVYNKQVPIFGWVEISYLILFIGMMITNFSFQSKRRNLVAINDPKLIRGLNFKLEQ